MNAGEAAPKTGHPPGGVTRGGTPPLTTIKIRGLIDLEAAVSVRIILDRHDEVLVSNWQVGFTYMLQ